MWFMTRKIIAISSIALFSAACSGFGGGYDENGPLGFKETPQNYTKYLHSLDWGKGKTVRFKNLDKCESFKKFYKYFSDIDVGYTCKYGFVTVSDPTGERKCEIDDFLLGVTTARYKEDKESIQTEYKCS